MREKSTTQTLFSRCQILINLDENHLPAMTYDQCIEVCRVSRATVAKVVSLFASGGIAAVLKTNRNINSNNANRSDYWSLLFAWMKNHISFLANRENHGQCVLVTTKKSILNMSGMGHVGAGLISLK